MLTRQILVIVKAKTSLCSFAAFYKLLIF